MSKIETIVWDLGAVLIDWNPKHLFRKIFNTDEEIDWFIQNVCDAAWNHELDAGKPFVEAVREKIEEFPKYEEAIMAYWKRWPEMVTGPMSDSVNLLETMVEKDYQLLSLTNWSAETFPFVSHYDFFRHFEGVVMSGEEKLAKPDPAFFQIMIDRYEVKPANTLFIDDNLANIHSADTMGFQTIHFKHAEDLKLKLANLNII